MQRHQAECGIKLRIDLSKRLSEAAKRLGQSCTTPALSLTVLMIAAALLRMRYLEFAFNPDEAALFNTSRASVRDILSGIAWEKHPFGSYLIRHWMLSFSRDPDLLRLLGLVPGVLTVLVAYWMGRGQGSAAGFTCALLAAFSPGLLVQGQLFRHYALLVLAECVSVAGFAQVLKGGRQGWRWCTVGLCAAVLTHYSGWMVALCMLATLGLRAWLERRADRPYAVRTAACVLFTVLLCLPRLSLPTPTRDLAGYFASLLDPHGQPLLTRAQTAIEYIFGRSSAWLVLPVVVVGAVASARRQPWMVVLASLMVGSALGLAAAGSYPLGGRHTIHLFAPAAVLMGSAIQAVVSSAPATVSQAAHSALRHTALTLSLVALAAVPFVRRSVDPRGELPLRGKDFDRLWRIMDERVVSGSLVIADFQATGYAAMLGGEWSRLPDGWLVVERRGTRFLSRDDDLWFLNRHAIRRAASFASQHRLAQERVWLLHIGWPSPGYDLTAAAAEARATGAAVQEIRMPNAALVEVPLSTLR